jgi:ribose transport system ATP-binding protein
MIIRKMVGRDASMFFSRKPVEIGETRVKLKNFNKFGVVENVSLDVRKGEIFGIGGLVGSGRSELMTFVFGTEEPDSGKVIIDNKELKINSPKDAIKQGICFITEDRKKLGMLRGRNVIENIAVIHNENFKGPLLDLKEERSLSNKIVGELSIMVSSDEQKVEELSGGNQQKVIIGKWLIDEADLYIFDEPTKGVDVGAKEQIYNLLVELAEKGKCIIMISSDMPELLSMSDRIGVMRNGRMVEIFENEGITEEELIKKFIGV